MPKDEGTPFYYHYYYYLYGNITDDFISNEKEKKILNILRMCVLLYQHSISRRLYGKVFSG